MTSVPAPVEMPSRHRGGAAGHTRRALRLLAGVVILLVLARQLGAGPFIAGLRGVEVWAVFAALVITAGTTWCCTRRWALISARHGRPLPLRTAYVAYYRSQLINVALPGGVVGDVDRGLRHGWRPVLWERGIGQVVQLALAVAILLPDPWRRPALVALVVGVAALGSVAVLSALSTAGHLVVFLVAAAATGLPLTTLVPIGALVLLGAAIPLNVLGWGPREGVAAWAFASFGSTAATGLTVSVTFGVLSTLATLPGLLLLGRRDV